MASTSSPRTSTTTTTGAEALAETTETSQQQHVSEKLFGITELAEDILLLLPPAILHTARRINKHFNHLISTSSPIRQHLFLEPLASGICPRLENPFYPLLTTTLLEQGTCDISPSWREMLLTQPPVFKVEVCCKEDWSDLVTVENVNGVTLGDVAARGVVYGIRGSAEWVAYEGYEQMEKLKRDFRRRQGRGQGKEDCGNEEVEDDEEGEWMEAMRW